MATLVVSALPLGASTVPEAEVARSMHEGRKLLKKGDLEGAERAFRAADAASEGRAFDPAFYLAASLRAYNDDGQDVEALVVTRRLLALAESDTERVVAHEAYGTGLTDRALLGSDSAVDDLQTADQHFRWGLQYAPDSQTLHLRRALALTDLWQRSRGTLGDRPAPEQAIDPRVIAELLDRAEELGVPDGMKDMAARARCLLEIDSRDDSRAPRMLEAGGVAKPVKLEAPPPQYPEAARRAGVTGTVIIKSIIDVDGRVRCAWPLRGVRLGLTTAALEAVDRWRFEPGTVDGEPIEVWYNLTINFGLGRGF